MDFQTGLITGIVFTCLVWVKFGWFLFKSENCLSWAVRKGNRHGGRLLMRRSTFADDTLPEKYRKGFVYWLACRVPHFVWETPDGTLLQYTVSKEGRQWEDGMPTNVFGVWTRIWHFDGWVVPENEGYQLHDYRVIKVWQRK